MLIVETWLHYGLVIMNKTLKIMQNKAPKPQIDEVEIINDSLGG